MLSKPKLYKFEGHVLREKKLVTLVFIMKLGDFCHSIQSRYQEKP